MDVTVNTPPLAAAPPDETAHLCFVLDDTTATALMADARLAPVTPGPPARRVRANWYDTPDFAMARRGFYVRLRQAGRRHMLALEGPDIALEAPQASDVPDMAALGPDWAATLASLQDNTPLQIIFTSALARTVWRAGPVTLTFTQGTLQAEHGKQPVRGLGLSGPPADLYPLALALAEDYPLRLSGWTIAARGLALAGGPCPRTAKSDPGLTGAPSLDEAVVTLVRACLRHFTTNWLAFEAGDQEVAVHQMRVALRRLRALLGLLHRDFPCPEFTAFRAEARRLAANMGEARDWDVFTRLVANGPATAFVDEPGLRTLLAQCDNFRTAGHKAVGALLDTPDTTRFVLALELFLARRGFRLAATAESLRALSAPAQDFAAAHLARLHRKVAKRGRHLPRLEAHARHLVRIELKKLRYAAELFGGLFANQGKIRAYTKRATALQDELGHLNDLATARGLLARLQSPDPATVRAAGIVLGWCAHAGQANNESLRKGWRKFTESRPVGG